jgi:hypothetical protein
MDAYKEMPCGGCPHGRWQHSSVGDFHCVFRGCPCRQFAETEFDSLLNELAGPPPVTRCPACGSDRVDQTPQDGWCDRQGLHDWHFRSGYLGGVSTYA